MRPTSCCCVYRQAPGCIISLLFCVWVCVLIWPAWLACRAADEPTWRTISLMLYKSVRKLSVSKCKKYFCWTLQSLNTSLYILFLIKLLSCTSHIFSHHKMPPGIDKLVHLLSGQHVMLSYSCTFCCITESPRHLVKILWSYFTVPLSGLCTIINLSEFKKVYIHSEVFP